MRNSVREKLVKYVDVENQQKIFENQSWKVYEAVEANGYDVRFEGDEIVFENNDKYCRWYGRVSGYNENDAIELNYVMGIMRDFMDNPRRILVYDTISKIVKNNRTYIFAKNDNIIFTFVVIKKESCYENGIKK